MHELKTNTATRIAVGPLVDPTDGKTAETSLTVTDLSVQLYQIKNDGTAVVHTQFAPTASGGNNDMVHVTDDTAGVYDLELTAAQLNFLGNARITFYDVDGFLVHWIDILVVSAAYFDWKYGSTIPDVNTTKVGGTSQTAKDIGALNVTNINTLASHDPGATLVKPADLGTVQTGDSFAIVNSGTYGNAAIKSQLTDIHDTDLPAVKTDTAAVKTQTDKMAFTVANQIDANALAIPAATLAANQHVIVDSGTVTAITNNVNADIKKINGTTITGDGSATPWGPV